MQVLKRNVAVIVLAGLVLGGAGVAWAGPGPARPTVVAAAQTGGTTSTPTSAPPANADRRAKGEALRACVQQAGKDRTALRACLAAAGVPKPAGPGGVKPVKPAGPPRPGLALGALAKAVHGSVIIPGEGTTWQTVTFDRGSVNAAGDGSKIVLDRPDGQQVTLSLTADTRYQGIAGAAALQDGTPALVVSKDGKATLVVQKDPAHAKRPGAGNNGDAPVVPND